MPSVRRSGASSPRDDSMMDPQPAPEATRVRLAVVGVGKVGQAVIELASTKPWLDVVAVVARHESRLGQSVRDIVPSSRTDIMVSSDLGAATALRPDVAIVATSSTLRQVLPVLETLARAGVPAIC